MLENYKFINGKYIDLEDMTLIFLDGKTIYGIINILSSNDEHKQSSERK